ncbi:response regulator [Desulfosporosinus hippei]|uniref:Stage 0 sporulation protein A homolog n=1 Tax=Desulfosporosinus hippei DSM 8344 TaxID=1121419 RepID=A0A1G8KJH9_9FIRM|nr:response regulator [Desulfosporosinus hippei]SDI43607.1 two-component system, response regulator, stage 0 sporulation protein F/two-component system, NtrC family, response regulator AtoC [Desulfosporosinus hippei DSM 8344]
MPSELILVVDDNAGIRGLLKEVLESKGYKVEIAQNGKEAIEKFHKCVPSVVLLDSRMPGMNGVKVAEILKAVSPELPIIMISSYSEQRDIKIAQEKGFVSYSLTKPFDINEINKLLHTFLFHEVD